MSTIATIGYEMATLEDVIGRLIAAGVDMVVDVRAIAASRRPGFSKTMLAASLGEAGIDYRHLRALGTPKSGREAARAGRTEEMRTIYRAHLLKPEAQIALAEAVELARAHRIGLLCYEAAAPCCHRAMVAARISENTGDAVVDL